MKQKAKGWVIDPTRQTITAAELTWDQARQRIGADLLERVAVTGGELWVDEEGTLRGSPSYWVLNGGQLLAGAAFLCGDDWTNHDSDEHPEVSWLPAGRTIEPPKVRAYPVTADGLAQILRDAREEQGYAELAAVGSIPAEWPSDEAAAEVYVPEVGDFATGQDGFTGMIIAIDGDVATIRFIDGREVQVTLERLVVRHD